MPGWAVAETLAESCLIDDIRIQLDRSRHLVHYGGAHIERKKLCVRQRATIFVPSQES